MAQESKMRQQLETVVGGGCGGAFALHAPAPADVASRVSVGREPERRRCVRCRDIRDAKEGSGKGEAAEGPKGGGS